MYIAVETKVFGDIFGPFEVKQTIVNTKMEYEGADIIRTEHYVMIGTCFMS